MNWKLFLPVLGVAALAVVLLRQFESPVSVKSASLNAASGTLPPAEFFPRQTAMSHGSLAQTSLPAQLPELFHYQASTLDGLDSERAIAWDFSATRALQPGDSFAVILPSIGVPTEGIVTDESNVNGNRRLEGMLRTKDGAKEGPFSITLSEDGRFVAANFATAADHFSLEAGEHSGRIFSARRDAQRLEQGEQVRQD